MRGGRVVQRQLLHLGELNDHQRAGWVRTIETLATDHQPARRRTSLMDCGIPTEHTLAEMRARGVDYLVGTPKGRLTKLEQELLQRPWVQARETVAVKLLEQEDEFYLYVESQDRVGPSPLNRVRGIVVYDGRLRRA